MTFPRVTPRVPHLFTTTLMTGASLGLALGCAAHAPHRSEVARADLACPQVPNAGVSPLDPRAGDASVSVVTLEDLPGVSDDWEPNRVVGVSASMVAPPGWSRAFLERRILCYRATSAGDEARDWLLIDGSTIAVREVKGRFQITVTSEDPAIARTIVDSVQGPERPAPIAAAR